MAKQSVGYQSQLDALKEQLKQTSVSRGQSDSESECSDSDSASTDSDSLASSGPRAPEREYVAVPSDLGFCKASERAHDADQTPRRFSLHGYEVYDGLRDGRHGGG